MLHWCRHWQFARVLGVAHRIDDVELGAGASVESAYVVAWKHRPSYSDISGPQCAMCHGVKGSQMLPYSEQLIEYAVYARQDPEGQWPHFRSPAANIECRS